MRLSYETHFRSGRPDGRYLSAMAAQMARLRDLKPKLALPADLTPEAFPAWQSQVRERVRALLQLPEMTPQPAPVRLDSVRRDGYTVERWELYPDDYSVVPFLMLIPDGVRAENPAPGVLCQPGSTHSKELLAGEPLLDMPAARCCKYPERNCMAKFCAQNGMVALAFDNPETAQTALNIEREGDWGSTSRVQMCFGLLESGFSYAGLTVQTLLCALEFLKTLDFVDPGRLAVSAHSLGTYPAAFLGLLCDEIRAVVFNDFICDSRERFVAVTEEDETAMHHNEGNWHTIPGMWQWFGIQDVLAALAPKYLAINEGGAECYRAVIRRGYALAGHPERLRESHYPRYADPAARTHDAPLPLQGLTSEAYFDWSYCDVPDHSFRPEPSLRLLKECFRIP